MRCSPVVGLILATLLPAALDAAPRAELVGSLVWKDDGAMFGGFSALETTADGAGFVAVTDAAAVYSGRFLRGAEGQVISVESGPPVRLNSRHARPLEGSMADAEGVALAPGGGFYVSFETEDRIAQYGPGGSPWIAEDWPRPFFGFAINAGLEALAIDARGTLFAVPERPPLGGATPVFQKHPGGEWEQRLHLRRDRRWNPVGADFGPDGMLYLLERDFWPLLGFASRVRQIALADDRVVSDRVLWLSEPGWRDNLEGLAAWQDTEGGTRLTLISDNNFLFLQKTEIVDLRVIE